MEGLPRSIQEHRRSKAVQCGWRGDGQVVSPEAAVLCALGNGSESSRTGTLTG